MTELTIFELALLRLVQRGRGQWGWHELGSRLSGMDVPRDRDMMEALRDLAARGLLLRHRQTGSPTDRWELTDAGALALAEAEAQGSQG